MITSFNRRNFLILFLIFLFISFCLFYFHGRRVHITESTLACLHGEYQVEPGNGGSRKQDLRDHNVHTYFIIPPARRRKVSIDFYFTVDGVKTSVSTKKGGKKWPEAVHHLRMFVACLFSLCFAFLDPSVRSSVCKFKKTNRCPGVS